MSDLISRQALCEYALNQRDKSVTPNDIMRFPSAQPEIIRCGDCKYKGTKNCLANAWTTIFGVTVKDDFYCGLAERRAGE